MNFGRVEIVDMAILRFWIFRQNFGFSKNLYFGTSILDISSEKSSIWTSIHDISLEKSTIWTSILDISSIYSILLDLNASKNLGSWKYWTSIHFRNPESWKYWKGPILIPLNPGNTGPQSFWVSELIL